MGLGELDFDWFGADAMGAGFFSALAAIRDHSPIIWSERQRAWIVTRYPDVEAGLRDPRLKAKRIEFAIAAAYPGDAWADFPKFMRNVKSWIINIDAPEHMRFRKLVMAAFMPKAIEGYRDFARMTFDRALQIVEDRPIDVLADVLAHYPSNVLVEVMGLASVVTGDTVREWSNVIGTALARPMPNFLSAAERVTADMTDVLRGEIVRRRRDPGPDLLSQLAIASEEGGQLSEHDMVSLFQIMLIGGFDTTAHTLALSLAALDRFPDQRHYMAANRHEMPQMINELARFISVVPVITRLIGEEFEWHGQGVKAGDTVYLATAAANHDPSVFPDPGRLDFAAQRGKPNLSFGPGFHHCVGHALARMQIEVAHGALLDRYERIETLTDPITFSRVISTRTPKEVVVRFHPRAQSGLRNI